MNIIKKIQRKLQVTFFPSEHDKLLKKWHQNRGDETLRLDYNIAESDIVLDIGGYTGTWSNEISKRYKCNIHVFEPVPAFYQEIKDRFNGKSNIHVNSFGLGAISRTETIKIHGVGSSIYRTDGVDTQIRIKNIIDYLNEHQIVECALVKINIEGGEYELLQALIDAGIINKLKNIQVQFHKLDENSEELMQGLCKELSQTHELTYHYKFIWDNWKLKQ